MDQTCTHRWIYLCEPEKPEMGPTSCSTVCDGIYWNGYSPNKCMECDQAEWDARRQYTIDEKQYLEEKDDWQRRLGEADRLCECRKCGATRRIKYGQIMKLFGIIAIFFALFVPIFSAVYLLFPDKLGILGKSNTAIISLWIFLAAISLFYYSCRSYLFASYEIITAKE